MRLGDRSLCGSMVLGKWGEEGGCMCVGKAYDGNIPYSLATYDMRPFNTAIGRND